MSSAEGPPAPTEATPPEPERAPAGAPADAPKKKKKKKLKPPPPPPPMTEEEINSPTKQTIGMLGVLGIMTLCMWVFARGGCNYHPPKETRDPRKVDLVDLARDPKDAALEFELRWSTKSYGGAKELAKGPMLPEVERQERQCDADPGCAKRASELRGQVHASAALLEREPTRAVVRVLTVGVGPKSQKHIVRVERDGAIWKVTSRVVDDGTFKPRTPEQIMLQQSGQMLIRRPGMPGAPEPASSAAPK